MREPPEEGKERTIAGVRLTHPGKVLYPERGLTKLDLGTYFERVAPWLLPHVAGRPLMLLRCPEGYRGGCFFQKHPGKAVHPSLKPVGIREARGPATYLTVRDQAGLLALVQMGVLEIHVWGAQADRIEQPDRMVFDLDPHPSTPWTDMIDLARRVRASLERFELIAFVKTTGGKGLHVVVPIRRGPGWEDVKLFSRGIASELVREDPDKLTIHLPKAPRGTRIFVDTLRNTRGATWVAPYSPRARPGAPVSAPLGWPELTSRLRPERLTIETVLTRLTRSDAPWGDFASVRQTLTSAMLRALGKTSAASARARL